MYGTTLVNGKLNYWVDLPDALYVTPDVNEYLELRKVLSAIKSLGITDQAWLEATYGKPGRMILQMVAGAADDAL